MTLDLKFRGEHSNARGILNFRADRQIISGHWMFKKADFCEGTLNFESS